MKCEHPWKLSLARKTRCGREREKWGTTDKVQALDPSWPTDFGVWSLYRLSNQLSVTKWHSVSHWAVNAIVISKHQVLIVAGASWKSIVRAALKVKSLGFACSPSFSLSLSCVTFLTCGDFYACSYFARSTIPEGKWGSTRSLINYKHFH